jgi:hypothetical protein
MLEMSGVNRVLRQTKVILEQLVPVVSLVLVLVLPIAIDHMVVWTGHNVLMEF